MTDLELAEEMDEWLHSSEHPYRTVKLMTDAIAALRRGPERPPSGEMVTVLKSFAENRCHACGWPLAGSATDGCTPFNCSYRPNESSAEHNAWLKKAHEMESVRAMLSACEGKK